jgi:hypothetical protein
VALLSHALAWLLLSHTDAAGRDSAFKSILISKRPEGTYAVQMGTSSLIWAASLPQAVSGKQTIRIYSLGIGWKHLTYK